jgi:hypothetical protein
MSSLTRATFRTRLTGDATLVALLTGGIYDRDTTTTNMLNLEYLGRNGGLTAEGALKPFAYLQWATGQAANRFRDERHRLDIYVYEQDGDAVIEPAVRRIKDLLHRWNAPDNADESIMDVVFDMNGPEFIDPDLGNANGRFVRFQVQLVRKES